MAGKANRDPLIAAYPSDLWFRFNKLSKADWADVFTVLYRSTHEGATPEQVMLVAENLAAGLRAARKQGGK